MERVSLMIDATSAIRRRFPIRSPRRFAAACIQFRSAALAAWAIWTGFTMTTAAAVARQDDAGPAQYLAAFGVDAAALAQFRDDGPLDFPADDPQRELLLKIVQHVRRWDAGTLERWTAKGANLNDVQDNPQSWRGRLVPISGRVRRVSAEPLDPDDLVRFEIETLYRCQVELDEGRGAAVVFTTRIPRAWPLDAKLDEPVRAAGLFLRTAAAQPNRPLVLVADRLAWSPDQAHPEWNVSPGLVTLASLGVDAGLRDQIVQRDAITSGERELFYQMLAAAQKTTEARLTQIAREQIAAHLQQWRSAAAALKQEVRALERQLSQQASPTGDPAEQAGDTALLSQRRQDWAAAQARAQQAERGADSVVDLFNDPALQFGRLVLLAGTARRVTPIELQSPGGVANLEAANREAENQTAANRNVTNQDVANQDIVERFGMARYYEIELFTPDSQNNPIVVCTSTLPAGFPRGDQISEPIEVAGFFFKSWAFAPRRPATASGGEPPIQLAPLLISGSIRWTPAAPPRANPLAGVAAGLLFVVALAVIWWNVWRSGRSKTGVASARSGLDGGAPPDAFLQSLAEDKSRQADEKPRVDKPDQSPQS